MGQPANQPIQPQSFLAGYDPSRPLAAVSPGTVLANGQLFASHIFTVLKTLGTGLNESGLLDLAARAFGDVTGVRPTATEVDILRKIVGTVLNPNSDSNRPGTTDTRPTTTSVDTSGGSVVEVVVPPVVKVLVSTGSGTDTSAPETPVTPATPAPSTSGGTQLEQPIPPNATPPAP